MVKPHLYILFLFLLIACNSAELDNTKPISQSSELVERTGFVLSGYIYEMESKRALEDAEVVVNNEGGVELARYKRAITNENGYFELYGLEPGQYRVRVYYEFDFGGARVQQWFLSRKFWVEDTPVQMNALFSRDIAREGLAWRLEGPNNFFPPANIVSLKWSTSSERLIANSIRITFGYGVYTADHIRWTRHAGNDVCLNFEKMGLSTYSWLPCS